MAKKNTEERILDAAIKIFSEKGFSAATTSEIAKEAEVAEGTIFRYFPKKKELLHGIVLKAIDLLGENVVVKPLEKILEENRNNTTAELLKMVIHNRIKLFEKYFHYIKVILYEMQYHEDVRQLFTDKIAKEVIKIGVKIIEEGKNKGEIRDIDSFVVIRSFIGTVMMMVIQRKMLSEENTNMSITEESDILIDIFFNGIKKE